MKKLPIALQLYSVRDDMEKNLVKTLEAVKAMGYEGVEFAGLFGRTAAQMKELLNQAGLKPVSAHVPVDELLANIPGVVGIYREIGCSYIAIPWLDENRRPGQSGYQKLMADIAAIADECKKQGMTLLYHNHDFEFVKVEGEYALDIMYRSIPALQTELDTCWVNVAGEDPVAYLEKYSGRSPVVHLKDFVMPGKKPAQLYELIGVADENKAEEDDAVFEFRPNGYGAQDIPAIVKAAESAGAAWLVVEQDQPSMGKSAMECAKMSIDYLKSIGL